MFCACSREIQLDLPVSGQEEIEATLTLQVAGVIPGPESRALGATEENTIKEIDILVFSKPNAGTPDNQATFFYRAETVKIIESSATERKFKVSLRKSDDLQKLVVLANSRSAIEPLISGFTGDTYPNVMAALVMENTVAWDTDATYKPVPMWGEGGFKIYTDATVPGADVIKLIHSLARIDVVVASAAQTDFKLNGVWLYNPSTKGLLAPSTANWNIPLEKVTAVSLPGAGRAPATSFGYTTMTTADKALQGEIYSFEAPASTGNTDLSAACLVVRGSWNGEDNTFYRIDFHDGSNFMALLRNFHYVVSIDQVNGRGYPDAGKALAAGFTGLASTTHVWSGGEMGSVVWDGSNYLVVSDNEYTVYPENQNITKLKAATNYTSGWQASVKFDAGDGANWITLTTASGAAGSAGAVGINVTQNTVRDRTAIITITAGRLKQQITITQLLHNDLAVDMGDVEVIFSAINPQEFTLPIEWEPSAIPVKLKIINPVDPEASNYPQLNGYTKGLVFSGTNQIPNNKADIDGPDNGGNTTLKILPNADTGLAIFEERRSILEITATDAAGPTLTKTVLLRQFEYAIQVTGMQSIDYQLNTTYSLTLKANAQWKVEVSGATSGLTYSVTEGDPNISGITFSFKTGNTSGAAPVFRFSLKDHPTIFQDVVINHKLLEPNCYLVSPSGSVTIPLRKVFEIWKSEADLYNSANGGEPAAMTGSSYTTEILWQDNTSLVSVSPPTGNNANATFTVSANTSGRVGNAVVVLKEGGSSGPIRWSWHIWVVPAGYNPKATAKTNTYNGLVIMDRNLGATSATVGDINAYGLVYQWGRKDPFPGAINSTTPKAIYNSANTAIAEGTTTAAAGVKKISVAVAKNLANATKNPLIFYLGVAVPNRGQERNWYTNGVGAAHRTDFWNANIKTPYDPCPAGWVVPSNGNTVFAHVPAVNIASGGVNLIIGYFPLTGLRRGDSDGFQHVGTELWGRTCQWGQLDISSTDSYFYTYAYRAYSEFATGFNGIIPSAGAPVRCVEIK